MKALLTLGVVLGLLMTSAGVEVTAQREITDFDAEQHVKNIEICTQNLAEIGKSIQVYKKEKGDYPEWLSDLHHPTYLPDPEQYGIRGIPAPWLIDKDGTLITKQARGRKLGKLVAEALKE